MVDRFKKSSTIKICLTFLNISFNLTFAFTRLSGVIKDGGPSGGKGVSDKELLKEALKVAKTKG